MKAFKEVLKKQDAEGFDTLFNNEIKNLKIIGTLIDKPRELQPQRDRSEILERVNSVYEFLVQNELQTQTAPMGSEILALLDSPDVTVKINQEIYKNGELIFSDLAVAKKDSGFRIFAVYKDGKLYKAQILKAWIEGDRVKLESASVIPQKAVPEGKSKEEKARKYFQERWGVDDPIKKFMELGMDEPTAKATWEQLVAYWGDWTVRTYYTYDDKEKAGRVELTFVYGNIKIKLLPFDYRR